MVSVIFGIAVLRIVCGKKSILVRTRGVVGEDIIKADEKHGKLKSENDGHQSWPFWIVYSLIVSLHLWLQDVPSIRTARTRWTTDVRSGFHGDIVRCHDHSLMVYEVINQED